MKKLINFAITLFVLSFGACRTTDVAPDSPSLNPNPSKHTSARITATASVYITDIEMRPATSPLNPYPIIRIKFLCPDVTNVHTYKIDVSTNNNPNWTTLTASTQQLTNIALPNAAPLLPSARAYQMSFTNVSSALFFNNAPQIQFRIIAIDGSGNVIGTSWPASTRTPLHTVPFNSPAIISCAQLLHNHTKNATGKPQIVLDWGITKSAYVSAGFPNPDFEIWSSANGVNTILYKSSSGWDPGAAYKLLSNAPNQTSIVVDALANNTPLAVGSSHSFYVVSKPFTSYMYAHTSSFTTRVPSIFPGCQMRPNTLSNSVVKYEKVEFATGKYWVFLNWGEAQLGALWAVDYRPVSSGSWNNWGVTGRNFLQPIVFYPGTYQVRVTPNGFGGFNAVNVSNMVI